MKTKSLLIILIVLVTLQSCNLNKKENTTTEETFWVNSYKTECDAGAGKAQCLSIYKGNDPTNANWSNFMRLFKGLILKKGNYKK